MIKINLFQKPQASLIDLPTMIAFAVVIVLGFSLNALAKGKKAKPKAKMMASSLSTNVEFDPLTVHGRYKYAAEATAKVENEKVLFDLLGPRKDFKDRLNKQGKQR